MDRPTKAQLKKIRELSDESKVREAEGLFVAEGRKIVSDLMGKGYQPLSIYMSETLCSEEEGVDLTAAAEDRGVPVFILPEADFRKISSLKAPQGVLAVVKIEHGPATEKNDLLVLCEGIQDPGNLGTIFRTAAAFGVEGILMKGDSADPFSPKVVRASSGTVLDIPITRCEKEGLSSLKNKGFRLVVGSVSGDGPADDLAIIEKTGPVILGFGSEGKGVSDEVIKLADILFWVPIKDNTESLNVTAAAAITIYQFAAGRSGCPGRTTST